MERVAPDGSQAHSSASVVVSPQGCESHTVVSRHLVPGLSASVLWFTHHLCQFPDFKMKCRKCAPNWHPPIVPQALHLFPLSHPTSFRGKELLFFSATWVFYRSLSALCVQLSSFSWGSSTLEFFSPFLTLVPSMSGKGVEGSLIVQLTHVALSKCLM